MNLSNISDAFYSHPNYSYKTHATNVAAAFDEKIHKEAAMFHDVGKLSNEFQRYISDIQTAKKTTHSLEGALIYLLSAEYKISPDTLAVFLSILKHHGNLSDTNDLAENVLSDEDSIVYKHPKLRQKIESILNILKIDKRFDIEKNCELFETNDFVEDYNLKGLKNYYNIKEVFSKLIFADKYEAIFKESYTEECSRKLKANIYINRLLNYLQKKNNSLSETRNIAREEIIGKFKKNENKRIYIIEAPTGIGKTLTALYLALKITEGKGKKRIINALPMTSIIDQTFEEYSNIIDKEDLLKFHHLTYSKNYRNENDETNQTRQRDEYTTASWSLDKVIITTFNQIFNCFYSNTNRDLIKFWTLRNSVIIMDEIQAIPRVLLQDIAKTINFLSQEFDIDFILMSATIPSIKGFLDENITISLLDTKYFSMDFNNKYILSFDKKIDSINRLAEKIILEINAVNSLLCIVNTKKTALNLFLKLQDSFPKELFLLTANFIPLHRIEIIKRISDRLNQKERTILISTQVMEVGVDLDFDIGFREFAPFASIIQAAGRINREKDKKNSRVIITNKINGSPYHEKDVAYQEISQFLKNNIESNRMLPYLKKYFDIVIRKTSPDTLLIDKMENLKFTSVAETFEECFMGKLPYIVPAFIEIEDGLYDKFKNERYQILNDTKKDNISMENKMKIRLALKNINKEISWYVIQVPEKEINYFPKIWEGSDIYYCPYSYVKDESKYSKQTGWISQDKANYM